MPKAISPISIAAPESTLDMASRAAKSWAQWEILASDWEQVVAHPKMLDVDDKRLVEEAVQALGLVWASQQLFQKDEAMLAEYFPITAALRNKRTEYATRGHTFAAACAEDRSGAEHRHLHRSLPKRPGALAGWSSLRLVMEVSSLLRPTYRQGRHLHHDRAGDIRKRCEEHLLLEFMTAHGIKDPTEPVSEVERASPFAIAEALGSKGFALPTLALFVSPLSLRLLRPFLLLLRVLPSLL